jgi:hypothetical protein
MNAAQFARALLDPAQPFPGGLHAHNGSDPAVRFAVYRNNVVSSLIDALSEAFPVARQLVGNEFFTAMARVFIMRHPPRSPVLADWGDGFAAFVEDFEPAASVPYLADEARLERARVRAYHAADAAPLDGNELARQLSDRTTLAGSRVTFHPSAQIVESDFAIVSLWAAHQGHGDIGHVDPFAPEAALILREDEDAAVLRVPVSTGVFLRRLWQGDTLSRSAGEGAVAAAAIGEPFDLAESLAVLIRHRALLAWHQPLEPSA